MEMTNFVFYSPYLKQTETTIRVKLATDITFFFSCSFGLFVELFAALHTVSSFYSTHGGAVWAYEIYMSKEVVLEASSSGSGDER